MFPTTIVDNFFESPSLIRDYALNLEYKKYDGNYPGIRTDNLKVINRQFYDLLCSKTFSLFFDLKKENINWDIDARFQLIDESFEEGWAHQDGSMYQFAGVVYLNPNAPLNGGTSFCSLKHTFEENCEIRNKFYNSIPVNMEEYRTKRNEHNSNFNTTLEISNVFNRFIFYDANIYHKENKFFGVDKEARLTLVFFGNSLVYNNTILPITRSKTITTD